MAGSDEEQRRLNLKMQKQSYRSEKKRVATELVQTLKDPTVVVMADWLKIRGTLRKWSRLYCVLKPGIFLLYKSPKTEKHGYWVGTVLLNCCELIERPSKKDGFCFKLFHPLDQSIWATRGPRGESLGAVTMPLPSSYLICRAASEEAGHCWMDALELALRCSSLLMRTMNKLSNGSNPNLASNGSFLSRTSRSGSAGDSSGLPKTSSNDDLFGSKTAAEDSMLESVTRALDDTEAELHFADVRPEEEPDALSSEDEADRGKFPIETEYEQSPPEVFGALDDSEQTEEVPEENKSLIWTLMKQVRPGMDLSKVVLPTFILEPRSFLEKLADFYYHCDLLSEAVKENDPFQRMVAVVKFYLSGFYKKPKGLKKPYNPILGEVYRCFWQHPEPGQGRTFYMSEQVSHHPPVSAFHVSNRQAGFNVCGTMLAKSKFYGNSLSAIMVGNARLTLLSRGENYIVGFPYAHCKGLILGTLTMELGGQVTICCDRTSYTTELDFKLKPFLGGSDAMNAVSGKIKLGRETLADIEGHWDGVIYLTDRQTGQKSLLWHATSEIINMRLQRYEVPVEKQEPFESVRLWSQVTEAIQNQDQVQATEEKTKLEEEQRGRAKQLREEKEVHEPRLFHYEPASAQWLYKHADYRPWDPQNDLVQTEGGFIVHAKSKHKTPLVRSASLISGLTPEASVPVSILPDSSEDNDDEASWPGSRSGSRRRKTVPAARMTSEMETMLTTVKDSVAEIRGRLSAIHYALERQSDPSVIRITFGHALLLLSAFFLAQILLFTYLFKKT